MLNTLFDETRRKEIQRSLSQGRPIELRRRNPQAEGMGSSGEYSRAFSGMLMSGTPREVCGYTFVYSHDSVGASVGIQKADGTSVGIEKIVLVGMQEKVIDIPDDGKRIRIAFNASRAEDTYAKIAVEPIFAEKD